MNARLNCLILFCFLLAIFGCSQRLTQVFADRGEDLREKVRAEWEAKVNGDWGAVYDMAVNEYKKKIGRGLFVAGSNVCVTEFAIKKIDILKSEEKALVVVDYRIDCIGFIFNMTMQEEWVWEDGGWRLNLMPLLKTPFNR